MPPEWLMLAIWGGWVALDGAALGQFMLSRPLVACLVGGWIMGAPAEVLGLAIILEAAHLVVLPAGATRYPEAGPPAAAAGAVLAALPPGNAALLAVVVATLAWEWISGRSVEAARGFNTRFVANAPVAAQPARHAGAIAVDFGRGVVLVVLAALSTGFVARLTLEYWPLGEALTGALLTAALVALLAASARIFGDHTRLWAGGLLAGAIYLVLT